MNRRAFLAGALAFLAAPRAAAQPQAKIARIRVLLNTPSIVINGVPPDPAAQRLTEAFLGRLRDLGYVEGRNLAMEYRFAAGRPERFPALAAELVNLNVDVILVNVNRTAMAAQRATTKIPIVIVIAEDPVGRRTRQKSRASWRQHHRTCWRHRPGDSWQEPPVPGSDAVQRSAR